MSTQPRAADAPAEAAPDNCDPMNGQHVFQGYVRQAHEALAMRCACPRRVVRHGDRRATIPAGETGATLTAALPPVLDDLALDPPDDVLLVMPAQVAHDGAGPVHRVALVRLSTAPLGTPALAEMVPPLLGDLLPGRRYRLLPRPLALLRESMALEIMANGHWVEVGHCGRVDPPVLEAAGLPAADFNAVVIELGLEQLHGLRGPVSVDAIRRGT